MLQTDICDFLSCSQRMLTAKINLEIFLKQKGLNEECICAAFTYLESLRKGICFDKQIEMATRCFEEINCSQVCDAGCHYFIWCTHIDRLNGDFCM